MIFNPSQCHAAAQLCTQLLQWLNTPDIGNPLLDVQVKTINANAHLLRGSFTQWDEFGASKISLPLPTQGHLMLAAAITPLPVVFARLLLDCKMDMESILDFDIDGKSHDWSLWTWLSSIVLDDGVVDSELMQMGWEVLLPVMLASGFDLHRPCGIYSVAHFSRMRWLEHQDSVRFEHAQVLAQAIILSRNTGSTTFNIASRRI
jgi:hypothetical protein